PLVARSCSTSACFTPPAAPEIYTLSLHDALPIWLPASDAGREAQQIARLRALAVEAELDPEFSEKFIRFVIDEVIRHHRQQAERSEEHTSELQSRENLVCRLLLEKKKEGQRTKAI